MALWQNIIATFKLAGVKFPPEAFLPQNRDYNRSPTSVGTFDVNGAAHVASRILAAILLASKNGGLNRVLLGSSLQKLDYQGRYRFQS